MQALKYQHRLVVAGFFAHTLREASPTTLRQADLLLALPLSALRLRERGFNQALEIARPLARQLALPLLIDGYTRVIDTAPQASLPWKERRKNIQGAFECFLDLTGKTVIVVDDVMTTGATLNEFARTLKKNGAAKVINWAVARALKH
ncbi:MAG: phosphoribosyltransferase family protein [Sterolibacterium sp.]|nr:phosphoribosyltransferase family protein [Sterolibacterium sp.]